MTADTSRVPDEQIETLIDPELRRVIGDPVPVKFAATVVYVPLLAIGAATSIFWTKTVPGPDTSALGILREVLAGCAVAFFLVIVTYGLARRVRPFQELEREFRRVLGDLSSGDIVMIAALSGAAEELLFRGTLQPWLSTMLGEAPGLVLTSVLFGLLHVVPYRVFLPWTAFALIVGFICGGLFVVYGSVVPPMVAHILLNAINLQLIVSGRRLKPA